jgi:hypothetical protein
LTASATRSSKNPKLQENPALREWNQSGQLASLKFMRTLWACEVTGGPFRYTGKELGEAHKQLHITPERSPSARDGARRDQQGNDERDLSRSDAPPPEQRQRPSAEAAAELGCVGRQGSNLQSR